MDYVNDADELGTLSITGSNDLMVAAGMLAIASCSAAMVCVGATVLLSITLIKRRRRVFTSGRG